MIKIKGAGFALLAMIAFAGSAQGAQLTLGTADTGSAFPFGANAYLGGYYTQQIYSASQFAAPISINNLTFFQSLYPGSANTGQYRISLGTTTFNDIANFDVNTSIPYVDASYTTVFDSALPSVASGKLSINLTTAFNYLPSSGNLLVTIFNPSLASNGTGYFDADNGNAFTNLRFSSYPYNSNQGLVTQFNGTAIAAVPEPATWAMMIAGFGVVGFGMRSRRKGAIRVTYA